MRPPPRNVRLVLVTPDGDPLGQLPVFPVASPWWPDAEPVVREARERYGLEVTVLRILAADPPPAGMPPAGGDVTYVAEVHPPVRADLSAPADPWLGHLRDHPLRQTWARPGGPAADLAWALSVMAEQGLTLSGPPEQIKSWNLSSLWRLPTTGGWVWLKVVPPFFAHEGPVVALLRALAPGSVPHLLGHDGARSLIADIPGDDQFDATGPLLLRMVSLLVDIQRGWVDRVDELSSLGLPDWRASPLTDAITSVVERTGPELEGTECRTLDRFLEGLAARFAAVADCDVPDTLVHGDFHPGNVRGDDTRLVLLDWGDSGRGHPLLDRAAFFDRITGDDVHAVEDHWDGAWRAARPGSDPGRAARLLEPVAAARQAVIYRGFLDRIEPSEHLYHRSDPADWLRRTARLVGKEERLET